MKLVLLFFCAILIFIILALLLIALSSIKLNIKKCYISNIEKGIRKAKLDTEFELYIEFYLLRLIKIFKIKITKELLKKLKIKNDMTSLKKDAKILKSIHPLEIIKKLNLKTEKANVYIHLGLDSINFTVYATAIISTILRNNICKSRTKRSKIRSNTIV